MATESETGTGIGAIVERPGVLILAVFVAYVLLDFVAKLFFIEITLGATTVLGGALPFSRLVTLVWDGIVIGLGLGLAGIGLSMTYSILGFANFSHGDYITSGGFAGWAVTFLIAGLVTGEGSIGYLLSVGPGAGDGPTPADLGINVFATPLAILAGLVVAIVAALVISLVMDRVIYKPMRGEDGISLLIASIGVALVLRYVIAFVFGGSNRGLTAGGGKLSIGGESGAPYVRFIIESAALGQPDRTIFDLVAPFSIGNYSNEILGVTGHEVTLVVVALALMGGLHLMLQRTKLGKAMRAMADNEDLARITGIPTERVIRATWIIGGGMAGASGYLIALERGTMGFNMGWLLLLLIFAAVILGGIGSVYGAMVGGIVIGLASTMALIWVPSSFATAAAFAIMILMLLFRPDGLFSGVTTA